MFSRKPVSTVFLPDERNVAYTSFTLKRKRLLLTRDHNKHQMSEPYRVLVVDDEAGIRKILRLFLELEGFQVFEAVSANQAEQLIQTVHPHIVILDVVLCGQTGFEVCKWVKENPETSDIIVILFTALNQEHDYVEGERVNCDYYLTKPQNPKDIIKLVKDCVQNMRGHNKQK